MKFLQVTLTLYLLLLLTVESSSSSSLDDTLVSSNITRGSSISTSLNVTDRYWLSPSGNFAFGFFQLSYTHSSSNCSDTYTVGIWSGKNLVWTANRKDLLPIHKPSSILFTNKGKLMLRILPDNIEKPLIPDMQEPASYAIMHDNGNFVLYGSESEIVWESFDHPTDTILSSRKLKPGVAREESYTPRPNHRVDIGKIILFVCVGLVLGLVMLPATCCCVYACCCRGS